MDQTRTPTTRRRFLQASGAAVAMACTGCGVFIGNKSTDAKTKPSENQVTLAASKFPALAKPGGQISVWIEGQEHNVMIFRRKDGTLGAVSIRCPHMGCDVDYQPEPDEIVCPCHSSRFKVTGEYVEGPAEKPLKRYSVSEADGNIVIGVGGEPVNPS